jgi:hypothetical protein
MKLFDTYKTTGFATEIMGITQKDGKHLKKWRQAPRHVGT